MQLNSFYAELLKYPKALLLSVILVVGFLGYFSTKVEIDASSETLLLKNDKDLSFTREINRVYASSDYLVITYTPKAGLLSEKTMEHIALLSRKLTELKDVKSVTSILNVPLLQDPSKSIKDILTDIPTLNIKTDKSLAKNEFLTSALYKNHLISSDFKTTALLINLKYDSEYFKLLNERNRLHQKELEGSLSYQEIDEFEEIQKEFKLHRDKIREQTHQSIVEIRAIMNEYKQDSEMFLGGINMITDDMVSFVKSDLKTYGVIVIFLIISIVWLLFREVRFVVLSVLIISLSVLAMSGILGLLGLEITVISSNFISMQMIITISLVIHLSIRYKEVLKELPDATHKEIILKSTLSMLKPSFYVILTTIVGFTSLVVSGILPVINLGWMMSAGVALSFLITFIVFPLGMSLFKKQTLKVELKEKHTITKMLSNLVETYPKVIYLVTFLILLFSISGANKILVENSFIEYFKKDTEIYKGMHVIDNQLGGTTPLDIIINLPRETVEVAVYDSLVADEFDEFEDEFNEIQNENQYWFTPQKMDKIEQIHNYLDSLTMVGKVLSFATTIKIGREMKHGVDLDSLELALLYAELPQEYRNILIKPYLNIEKNQLRFTIRVIDSMKDLRRDELLKRIQREIHEKIGIPREDIRLANMMVMYNNMLQSLFKSQVMTLGIVLGVLFMMFMVLFRSFKVAVIASTVNIIPVAVVFGFMGWSAIALDMMTITIAAISLGIAVDDTIHYIYRFKLEYKKDSDYLASMHRAHHSIGSAMFYTSVVIISGFSVLTLSSFYPTIHFGLLTMLAMFMAIVADLLLLPRLILLIKPFSK